MKRFLAVVAMVVVATAGVDEDGEAFRNKWRNEISQDDYNWVFPEDPKRGWAGWAPERWLLDKQERALMYTCYMRMHAGLFYDVQWQKLNEETTEWEHYQPASYMISVTYDVDGDEHDPYGPYMRFYWFFNVDDVKRGLFRLSLHPL